MTARDLRDPQKLGEWMQAQRSADPKKPMSEWCDIIEAQLAQGIVQIPDYDPSESLATVTAREYRKELQERADAGDIYAQSLLAGIAPDE